MLPALPAHWLCARCKVGPIVIDRFYLIVVFFCLPQCNGLDFAVLTPSPN